MWISAQHRQAAAARHYCSASASASGSGSVSWACLSLTTAASNDQSSSGMYYSCETQHHHPVYTGAQLLLDLRRRVFQACVALRPLHLPADGVHIRWRGRRRQLLLQCRSDAQHSLIPPSPTDQSNCDPTDLIRNESEETSHKTKRRFLVPFSIEKAVLSIEVRTSQWQDVLPCPTWQGYDRSTRHLSPTRVPSEKVQ